MPAGGSEERSDEEPARRAQRAERGSEATQRRPTPRSGTKKEPPAGEHGRGEHGRGKGQKNRMKRIVTTTNRDGSVVLHDRRANMIDHDEVESLYVSAASFGGIKLGRALRLYCARTTALRDIAIERPLAGLFCDALSRARVQQVTILVNTCMIDYGPIRLPPSVARCRVGPNCMIGAYDGPPILVLAASPVDARVYAPLVGHIADWAFAGRLVVEVSRILEDADRDVLLRVLEQNEHISDCRVLAGGGEEDITPQCVLDAQCRPPLLK